MGGWMETEAGVSECLSQLKMVFYINIYFYIYIINVDPDFFNESDQPNKINISHMMGTNIKKE